MALQQYFDAWRDQMLAAITPEQYERLKAGERVTVEVNGQRSEVEWADAAHEDMVIPCRIT
jgi:hypothetical protein